MPISEDEFENRVHSSNPLAYHHYHQQQLQMAMSKAEQRKNNKPIMEKKRRARINSCLNELKSLILDAMKKDPARHSKLEKADILEMTVKHLQSVQKQQLSVAMTADPSVVHKFKNGFSECATEVNRFIGRLEGLDAGLKQRLVNHLGSCVTGLQQISPLSYAGATQTPAAHSLNIGSQFLNNNLSLEDLNNNRNGDELQRLQAISGIQLIPSRLPTGEFAFVLPNSASSGVKSQPLDSPNLISEIVNRSHASAFTAVHNKLGMDEDSKDEKFCLLSPSSVSSSSPVSFSESSTVGMLGNNNDEVTSTSNLDQFKIPQRNFNKSLMKNKLVYQNHSHIKPEELLLKEVSRESFTSIPSVSITADDNLKYENNKHDLFTKSFLNSQKLIKPLTVITNTEEKDGLCGKNPLDFSMKKIGLGLVQPVESSQLCESQKSLYEPLIKIERSESEPVVKRPVPEIDSISQRLIQSSEIQVRLIQDGFRKTVPTILPKDLSQARSDESFLKKHERSSMDCDRSDPPSKRIKLDSSEDDADSPRHKSESSPLSSSTLSTSTLSTSNLSTSNLSTSSGLSSAEKDSMWRPW